ncbi:hypothetical protein JOB18_044459 [Solea senegalensis]|uniref:Uncharacterized protein n=1 Tax=Solea senegalensis TaxID=28829 RepID=A0AAV6R544_SOLSE|nr:hypothetical protein JOB18_044459 [Solea senegalensis]
MEFIGGSFGTYRPIRVLFETPIYERALQTCWHLPAYKIKVGLVAELLKLQQEKRIPSEVTVEDMTQLLMEKSKGTLRVQLWEFELEGYDAEVTALLNLVWEVNNSMLNRDVVFEARKLLKSPDEFPASYKNHKFVSMAREYGEILTEKLQVTPCSKLLGPHDVVMEIVPKVLQGLWLAPPTAFLNTPSQYLSKMAVGVTKAVWDHVTTALPSVIHQVTFSTSIRDDIVLSIQEKVKRMNPHALLRRRKLDCFDAQLLDQIANVATSEICALFQSNTAIQEDSPQSQDCVTE